MRYKYFIKYMSLIVVMFFAFNFAIAQTPRTQNSKDFAILVHSTVSENPPSITLNWSPMIEAKSFEVSRKLKTQTAWTKLADLDSGSTAYTDNSVEKGVAYEYQVLSMSEMYVTISQDKASYCRADKDGKGWMPYVSTGYIYTGINVPPPAVGTVLLVIEEELTNAIGDKISQLEYDMKSEGWTIIKRTAPRTEKFDGIAVKNVKSIILEEYNKDPNNLTTVLLLGRIAVPYSGNLNPDAHPDHKGAWPADAYYGIINENMWTDNMVNTATASRAENKNLPNDGKFDPSDFIYDNITLQIGRVDLYGMPAFYDSTTKKGTERDLLANYLDKNHKYRTGELSYLNQGIISDGFSSMIEGFASSGWRTFGALFSADSVTTGNWVKDPDSTKTYLWSYGCSGGNYTGYGLGNTVDFATKKHNTVFTMLFGSYFGDWDHDNAFLRAPLASQPSALTCVWSGRPHWYFHLMGLGEPIGTSYLLSANNNNTYLPNLYYHYGYNQYFIYAVGMKNVHIALMGDPTLRMNYKIVLPPKEIALKQIENKKMEITWKSSNETDAIYYVYRASDATGLKKVKGAYKLLNTSPITGNKFIDSTVSNGKYHYKVVAALLQNTVGSGSYYTTSAYISDIATVTGIDEIHGIDFSITASPNPTENQSEISFSMNKTGFADIAVFDLSGNKIKTIYNNFLSAGVETVKWNLFDDKGNKVPSGVYFVKISSEGMSKVAKLIVR